jgi:uncharacterized membrane protein
VSVAPGSHRLGYLDWLRGVAVLIMIEAHSFDSWTRPEEKAREAYGLLMVLGGMGAPAFLFLAGTGVALAAAAHIRRGRTSAEASRLVQRRGWQVFLFAFLFRLQSFLLGGFTNAAGLLKVDVLNVMGPAMVATAVAWRVPGARVARGLALTAAAVAISCLTPAVRDASWPALLPGFLEDYLRPQPGRGTFTLFPWAGFVLAGGVLGLALDGGRHWPAARLQAALAAAGLTVAASSYWASLQPPLFPTARFWTSSPAYFALRVGLLVLAVPLAHLWSERPVRLTSARPVAFLGVGSLFVYFVHVELVYGWVANPLKGRLTLEQTALAFALLVAVMYGLLLSWTAAAAWRVKVRERIQLAWNHQVIAKMRP